MHTQIEQVIVWCWVGSVFAVSERPGGWMITLRGSFWDCCALVHGAQGHMVTLVDWTWDAFIEALGSVIFTPGLACGVLSTGLSTWCLPVTNNQHWYYIQWHTPHELESSTSKSLFNCRGVPETSWRSKKRELVIHKISKEIGVKENLGVNHS